MSILLLVHNSLCSTLLLAQIQMRQHIQEVNSRERYIIFKQKKTSDIHHTTNLFGKLQLKVFALKAAAAIPMQI